MKKCCLMVGLVLGLAGLVSASTYDLNADFDIATNPNGVWTYGHVQGGVFDVYDMATPNIAGLTGINARQDQTTDPAGSWCPTDWLGWITKNTNPTDVVVEGYPNRMRWFAGKTHMMTPVAGAASGISTMTRFTAPTTSLYDVNVDFLKASLADVAIDVQVLVNGLPVLSQRISGADVASYDGLGVNLTAGQTVDLLTIPVSGSSDWDGGFIITQVDATITSVPEPATLGLLALGGLLLRRKS